MDFINLVDLKALISTELVSAPLWNSIIGQNALKTISGDLI